MSSAKIEQLYPYAGGVFGAVVFVKFYYLRYGLTEEQAKDLFSAVLNLSAIVAGFIGAAISILYTMEGKEVIRDLVDLNKWPVLLGYLVAALKWSFFLAVLSAMGTLFYQHLNSFHRSTAIAIWSGMTATAALL